MRKVIRHEIKGLLKRGTFKVILKEVIPADANVLHDLFVLAITSNWDVNKKYKARYVIYRRRDKLKSRTLQKQISLQLFTDKKMSI